MVCSKEAREDSQYTVSAGTQHAYAHPLTSANAAADENVRCYINNGL
jgi:hypothetical protein